MRFGAKLVYLFFAAISIPTFAKETSGGFVWLEPIQQIVEELDTWPLIVKPKSDAERRINTILGSYNAETRKLLLECKENEEWSRAIRVTMTGPRYLSLQANGRISCGGPPHPDPYDATLVFNLATGELLDGSTIVEKNSGIAVIKDNAFEHYPQSDKFLLSSPVLDSMLMVTANNNCKKSLQEVLNRTAPPFRPILYSVWPDAKKNQVVVKPVSLSYLDYLMCAEEIDIPLSQARKLGFTKSFIRAINIAHSAIPRS